MEALRTASAKKKVDWTVSTSWSIGKINEDIRLDRVATALPGNALPVLFRQLKSATLKPLCGCADGLGWPDSTAGDRWQSDPDWMHHVFTEQQVVG
jgi:hypothetical protein